MDFMSDKVVNPVHYERTVRYLRALNPACKSSKWAMQVINACITRALNEGNLVTFGMVVAIPSNLSPGKVHLAILPDRDCELPPIHETAPMEDGQSPSGALPLIRRPTIEWGNKEDNAHHSG